MSDSPVTRWVISSPELAWIMRLRWAAMLAQASIALAAELALGIALPLRMLGAIVLLEAISNMLLWSRRRAAGALGAGWLAALLAFDVLSLTALLMLTGGRLNPFSCLYLIYVALSAVMLPAPLMRALLAWSLGCFGLLFMEPSGWPPPAGLNHAAHVPLQLQLQLRATWCAFAVAACSISYFTASIRRVLGEREAELSRAAALAAQSEQLISRATLATGAAHELSTPLATIAVVAKELERTLSEAEAEPREDARSIRREVERCREILQQIMVAAGTVDARDRPSA